MEEGVRVALLKLVTDGSRPIGEMSDSWGKVQETFKKLFHEKRTLHAVCTVHSELLGGKHIRYMFISLKTMWTEVNLNTA